jgi:hypothetical protein
LVCCLLLAVRQGEDLRVLPKAKLGSNQWCFINAAVHKHGEAAEGCGSAGGSSNGSTRSGL